MYIILVFLPLLGAISAGFFGFFIGRKGSCYTSLVLIFFSMFFSFYSFYKILYTGFTCKILFFEWIKTSTVIINWEFLYDTVTIIMLIVVTSVSFVVQMYSIGYMSEDPSLPRFISYLSLFTFFMLILVTSNNLLQLFLGWEGVGICSYLLISFWFGRVEALKSALKAVIVNKIGDFFLFSGILICYYIFNSLNYGVIFNLVDLVLYDNLNFFIFEFNALFLMCLFFFIGAVGKSAQLGLHIWLPDAMEGPTPVSALIHAATMVTAGIFLIIRCSFVFEQVPSILILLVIFGSLTAFLGASIAMVQIDLKKIIAYSTCSQLGYMLFACGLSGYNVALYHLLNHAFFKALLFLSAGIIIHYVFDEQDLRKISSFGPWVLPQIVLWFFIIGSLAIAGFPGFSGFFSKDKILELAFSNLSFIGLFSFIFGSLTALITSFYSFRLLYLVFWGQNKVKKFIRLNIYKKIKLHKSRHMVLPLFLLVFGSIFSGYLLECLFVGVGSDFFYQSLPYMRNAPILIMLEFIPISIKLLPTLFSLFGCILSYIFLDSMWKRITYSIYSLTYMYTIIFFLSKKWNFDKIYNFILVDFIVKNVSYNYVFVRLEKGLLDYFIFTNLTSFFYMVSGIFSKLFYSGNIYKYSKLMLSFILVFFFCFGNINNILFFVFNFLINVLKNFEFLNIFVKIYDFFLIIPLIINDFLNYFFYILNLVLNF